MRGPTKGMVREAKAVGAATAAKAVCAAIAASAAVVTGVGVLAAEAALTDHAGEDEHREEVASLGSLAIRDEACPGLEPRPSLMLHRRNTIAQHNCATQFLHFNNQHPKPRCLVCRRIVRFDRVSR